MAITERDTLGVLRWARETAAEDPIVAMFWRKLCDAVNAPEAASAGRVLAELEAYGGNSIANLFRDGGVPYAEVAHDTAAMLNPTFGGRTVPSQKDVAGCEALVLWRMEVSQDDLDLLCGAVQQQAMSDALKRATATAVGVAAVEAAAFQSAKRIGAVAGERAAARLAGEVAVETAAQAGKQVAKGVAVEVAQQVAARLLLAFNVIMVAWLVVDLAGPARRVTIPGVTYVALLRKLHRAAQIAL